MSLLHKFSDHRTQRQTQMALNQSCAVLTLKFVCCKFLSFFMIQKTLKCTFFKAKKVHFKNSVCFKHNMEIKGYEYFLNPPCTLIRNHFMTTCPLCSLIKYCEEPAFIS